MSIPVGLGELAAAIEGYGTTPYLLTSAGGRPHAVSVAPHWRDGMLVMGAGRRTSANVANQPAVALLWPPDEVGGYSLIVDAAAAVHGDELHATPERAVLHRSADHLPPGAPAAGAISCGNDCMPVPVTGDSA